MRAVETIKNIWKIEDLRKRILITLLLVLIYRFGTYIVLPGIDPKDLTALGEQTRGGLMALLDMFSGGAFSNASIFALGIMPYISASIVMQLLAMAVPYFQKMQREGESGRKKINWYTRMDTLSYRDRVDSSRIGLFGESECTASERRGQYAHRLVVQDLLYYNYGRR